MDPKREIDRVADRFEFGPAGRRRRNTRESPVVMDLEEAVDLAKHLDDLARRGPLGSVTRASSDGRTRTPTPRGLRQRCRDATGAASADSASASSARRLAMASSDVPSVAEHVSSEVMVRRCVPALLRTLSWDETSDQKLKLLIKLRVHGG